MPQSQQYGAAHSPLDSSHVSLGLASIATGLLAGLYAVGYGIGTVTEMGPGFFPLLVSVLLIGLGTILILRRGDDLPAPEHADGDRPATDTAAATAGALRTARVLGSVLGGILVFAITVRPLGLFIAATLLAAIASLAHPGVRPWPVLLLSLLLALAATLIFVVGLKLNLNALPGLF